MYEPRPRTATALAAALQGVGGGLGWSLLPPLMPSIAGELKLSHVASGVVWGMAPLGIALASPLGGAFVDKYGPRRVATWAMLAGALACAARAVAVDAFTLGAAMFAFGAHVGFVAPAIPKALSGHVDTKNLARANGLALLAYTLGTALTVLTARTVLAPAFGGWRPVMVAALLHNSTNGNSLGIFSCSKATNEVNYLAGKLARVAFHNNNIDSCNRT